MKKIIVSGGHPTPALALIDYIEKNWPDRFEFVWVGRKWSQKKNAQPSIEAQEVATRKIDFIAFDSGKSSENVFEQTFKTLRAVWQARKIFRQQQPALFLSFGGYLAIPLALAAQSHQVPVVTHEQTRVLGKANLWLAERATALALSNSETAIPEKLKKNNPQLKIVVTGNPLRENLLTGTNELPLWWPARPIKRPILYISGGSQGAQAINETVAHLLPELCQQYLVIHQVGSATKEVDYVQHYLNLARQNQVDLNYYFVRPFLKETELAFIYPRVNLAIARAGANTVQELSHFAIPTLYIPLPRANFDEQKLNAAYYVNRHAALMLEQAQLTPANLRKKIIQLNRYQSSIKTNLQKSYQKNSANEKLFALISEIVYG